MQWNNLVARISQKPPLFIIGSLLLFLGLIFVRWRLNLDLSSLLFLIGGIIGLFVIDAAETFFEVHPSPFKTTLFLIGSGILGFYILSSTQELLAKGLVLGMNLDLLFTQWNQWQQTKDLSSWYTMLFGTVNQTVQRGVLLSYTFVVVLFILLSALS